MSRDGTRGWAYTKLTDVSEKAIEELGVDEDLFKGLKRKRASAREERYFSLIVNLDLKEPLKSALEATGMKQREFVEFALSQAINAAGRNC